MSGPPSTPRWALDSSLDWTEHYLRHGFCLLRGLLDPAAVDAALADVQRLVGDPRPILEWTAECRGQRYSVHYGGEAPAIDALFDQPKLAAALAQLFGARGFSLGSSSPGDADRRHFSLWINPYDADARPRLQKFGHIDSGRPDRAMAVQIALAPTSAFSGNTTYFPGSHQTMFRWLRDNPDPSWPGGTYHQVPREQPPWEFIAQAGDVVFAHQLVLHAGNVSHAQDRRPRIAIRHEVFPAQGPLEGAPASVFDRSLIIR